MSPEPLPESRAPSPQAPARVDPAQRVVALLEVIICSDFPTQIALAATFYALGFRERLADGSLSVVYVATLSLIDAALLIALIVFFLRSHGESVRDVFLGTRPIAPEIRAGVPMSFVALAIALGAILTIQQFAPYLRTEERNPLQDLLTSPVGAAVMAVVLVVAGGVREELQRAFLLRRFERSLGGPIIGVVVTSLAFGLGHLLQGADVALVTALLGVFWAIVYLRRRSVVAPIVSHAGFNLLQLGQFLLVAS